MLLDHGKFDKTAMYEISGDILKKVYVITDRMADWIHADGYLALGGFGQRNADRVSDAVGEQRPDSHGALDAP